MSDSPDGSMSSVEIVPFVHEGLGNSSYLIHTGGDRAILVDPDRSVQRYLQGAGSRGWRVVAILETHLHADFVSGSLEVLHAIGAPVYLPAEAGARFPHRGVHPGERLEIGDVKVEAIGSPGHTPEHLSYVVRPPGQPPSLFSGGALIVGGAARTDLIDPGSTESLTRAEFRTLREAFAGLPDETLLLPTHGGGSFCSVGSGDKRTSTIGEERRTNRLLAWTDEEEFVRSFPSTFPAAPAYFFGMRAFNQAGPRLRESIQAPSPLSPEELQRAQEIGALVVDVRPVAQYSKAHVPGSLSNPFRDAYATWLGWFVDPKTPLAFVTDGAPLERVVDESLLVGYERFAGHLDGGIDSWLASGRPVRQVELIGPAHARTALERGAVALDVREPSEFAAGHVEGAIHVPLGDLAARVGEIPTGRPVLAYCGHGERASTGVSVLERAGIGPLLNLDGGFPAWKEVVHREE